MTFKMLLFRLDVGFYGALSAGLYTPRDLDGCLPGNSTDPQGTRELSKPFAAKHLILHNSNLHVVSCCCRSRLPLSIPYLSGRRIPSQTPYLPG